MIFSWKLLVERSDWLGDDGNCVNIGSKHNVRCADSESSVLYNPGKN